MKKYLRCLLALGLLVGCSVENDNSEIISPPVEQIPEDNKQDNDEQTSTENDDADGNAQDTIEYVEKLDDTKDWIYIKEIKNKVYDDTFKNLEEYDYPYTDFNKNDLLQWLAISYMSTPTDEYLFLNIDSEEASILNENFKELYLNPKHLYCNWKWSINKDILSVFKKTGTFLPFSTGYVCYEAFHIDLKTGRVLKNDDLLQLFDIDKNTIQNKIDEYGVNHQFYKESNSQTERPQGMKGMMALGFRCDKNAIGYNYSDSSLLLVEDNDLYLILGIYDFDFNGHLLFHKIKLN